MLISVAYGSLQYKELERLESIANNGAPKGKELRTPPKGKELRTPPKGKELRHNGIVIMRHRGQAIVTFRNTTASQSKIRGLCQSANWHKCKRTNQALISCADRLAWIDQDA